MRTSVNGQFTQLLGRHSAANGCTLLVCLSSLVFTSVQAREVEEVIVTAQKREERLQDVPISVDVLSGTNLENSGALGVADALMQVAGVTALQSQPGQTQIALRGVVSGAGGSTTAYYLDEVPVSFLSQSELPEASAFDLSRVEVLRGPQGTLYGAAALSGVIRVLSNSAHLDEFQFRSRLRGSSTDGGGENYGADVMVNAPIIEKKLAVRGVVSYSDLSGFITSTFDQGRRINDTQAKSYRLRVNYQPTDSLNIQLGHWGSHIENGASSLALDNYRTPLSSRRGDDREYDLYNLIARYDWSNVSLFSSTSYFDYAAATRRELVLPFGRVALSNLSALESFSQEFRLVSDLEGSWQWSAGVLYKNQEDRIVQDARPHPSFPFPFDFIRESESYAVFGELKRAFADGRVNLTGGLRYFDDRHLTRNISSLTLGTAAAGQNRREFDEVTWRVVLDYEVADDAMVYASVATGFRSGLDQSADVRAAVPGVAPLDPDTVLNYEVGAKGSAFQGAFRYDVATYYMDWSDTQQSLIPPVGILVFLNAGNGSGFGVEGNFGWQLNDHLSLNANVGWSDLTLDANVLSRGVPLFLEGERFNNSPEWTGSLGATFRTPAFASDVDFVLGSDYTYRSSTIARYLTGTVAAPTVTQTESDNSSVVSARIGLESERWTVYLFGENLTDESGAYSAPDLTANLTSIRLRPRTIGLQLAFNY
jgi:iron complex outermembrane recepter protein